MQHRPSAHCRSAARRPVFSGARSAADATAPCPEQRKQAMRPRSTASQPGPPASTQRPAGLAVELGPTATDGAGSDAAAPWQPADASTPAWCGPRRRHVAASLAATPLLALLQPQAAQASGAVEARNGLLSPPLPSIFDVLTGGPGALPPPVRFPRRRLAQRFAVLLMQSCYRAADALDFIPMDEFQVRFWKLRQAAYSNYVGLHSGLGIQQGDLTDPLYFDFIAFAQFAALSEAMEAGRQEFEEYCEECPTRYRAVRRDPALADNRLLPGALQAAAGDRIYASLLNGFPSASQQLEQFGGPQPAPTGAALQDLVAGATAIVDIFVARGFATKGAVTSVRPAGRSATGGSFTVRLQAPANLWGAAALQARRASLVNAYDAFAIGGYLRASGVAGASYVFVRSDAVTETHWMLP